MNEQSVKVYKRGRVYWADLRALGKGRVSTGETDLKKAREAASRLAKGRGNGHTLKDAFERAWEQHYRGTKGSRNVYTQLHVMDELVGGTRLTEVDTPWVGELSTKLRGRGIGASTVNRYLAVLSKVMKLASQWGWVTGVPYMPRGKEGSHRIRVVTEVEEKQLLQHFHAHHTGMLALTSFLLDTGCRLGEALAITAIDRQKALQAGRWTIWVNKGDRPRTVPLTTRARHALAHWGWEGMSARQCQAAWDKARTAMGLKEDKGFVIHALRHTCATRLVDKDVPLTVIRDYLGHSTVAVTERYAHLNPRALEAAALCLETVTTGEYDASVLVCKV